MLTKSTYTITKTNVTDQYVDFELDFTEIDRVSFSFWYRIGESGRWHDDVTVECTEPATVTKNVLSNVSLSIGTCHLRWYYILDNVGYNESVRVEIRPEPCLELYTEQASITGVYDVDTYGLSDVSIVSGKRYSGDVRITGNSLYYQNTLVSSALSSPSYVCVFSVLGSTRMLVADTGNSRLVEFDTAGTLISQYVPGSFAPVYCAYNNQNGNVLFVNSTGSNVGEIYWKVVATGLPSPSIGTSVWSYNTDFPSNPLTAPVACTYGYGNDIVITDGSIIKVDRDATVRTVYSSFVYKREVGTEVQNTYTPNSFGVAFETDIDKFVMFEAQGQQLNYSNSPNTHVVYNRSLHSDAVIPCHGGLENDLFRSIVPNLISTDVSMTVRLLNSAELSENVKKAYIAFGRDVPVLDGIADEIARGDVLRDKPLWGVLEGYNRGRGAQTLVCLTGQEISVNVPYDGVRIGYRRCLGGIEAVYVNEEVAVSLVDVFTGDVTSYQSAVTLEADLSFSVNIPEATQTSYDRSLIYGSHGLYLLKVTVLESYFSDNNFVTSVYDPKEFNFFVPIASFWWRQVFKDIQIGQSPVYDYGFDLNDYFESQASFFNLWTVYPGFQRVVGTTTLSLTTPQKQKILSDNALALLSFYTGMSPGDSPLSSVFGLEPSLYVAPEATPNTNLHRTDLTDYRVTADLPGLNAAYQATNVFQCYPGVGPISTQYVRDMIPLLFVDSGYFSNRWGENGLVLVPSLGSNVNVDMTIPNGRVSLDFSIDDFGLKVDSISIHGKYVNSDLVRPGDPYITVKFTTTSIGIASLKIGVCVDNSAYSVFEDATGLLRQYTFCTPSTIADDSMVQAFVELVDSDGRGFVAYASKKVFKPTRVTSLNNLFLSIDRTGKRLVLSYDLLARYGFIPYDVDFLISKGLGLVSVADLCSGDIGQVFSGLGKVIVFNYGEELTATEQLERLIMRLTFTAKIASDTTYSDTMNFSVRMIDLWDWPIEEEVAVFLTSDDILERPARRIATEHVYNPDEFMLSTLVFETDRSPYTFSSSSSCSSSSSSSLVSDSCSSHCSDSSSQSHSSMSSISFSSASQSSASQSSVSQSSGSSGSNSSVSQSSVSQSSVSQSSVSQSSAENPFPGPGWYCFQVTYWSGVGCSGSIINTGDFCGYVSDAITYHSYQGVCFGSQSYVLTGPFLTNVDCLSMEPCGSSSSQSLSSDSSNSSASYASGYPGPGWYCVGNVFYSDEVCGTVSNEAGKYSYPIFSQEGWDERHIGECLVTSPGVSEQKVAEGPYEDDSHCYPGWICVHIYVGTTSACDGWLGVPFCVNSTFDLSIWHNDCREESPGIFRRFELITDPADTPEDCAIICIG